MQFMSKQETWPDCADDIKSGLSTQLSRNFYIMGIPRLYLIILNLSLLEFHGTPGQIIRGPGLMWTSVGNDQSQLMLIPGSGQSIYTNTTASVTVNTKILLSQGASVKAGLATDHAESRIFWTDPVARSIFTASFMTGSVGAIYRGVSDFVEGIAVDWIANKLYWTDASYNWIVVSDYTGDNVRTLVHTGLDRPRGIAVDPIHGHLYWCDLGANGRIEKSNLDGSDRRIIVSEATDSDKIAQPNGLAIDFEENRLYWTDGVLKKIMSVDLGGDSYTVREVLTESGFAFPFDISLDEEFFFVSDHSTGKLWIIRRSNILHRAQLTFGGYKPLGMSYYSDWPQPAGISPCSNNNGGCHHLCVGDPSGHKCLCNHGFVLAPDNSSCVIDTHLVPGHQILYSTGSSVCRLPVDFAHSAVPVTEHCFINGLNAGAMDYDFYQDMLYFYDASNTSIRRAVLRDDPSIESIVADVSNVFGIAVDWLANNLYWTDSEQKAIYISRLDGSYKTVLLSDNIDEPRGIAVHPGEKSLFWADSGPTPRIEKSALSGRQRDVLISTSIVAPTVLTIDHVSNRLYWVDQGVVGKIESIGTNGEQRKLIQMVWTPIYGLTVFQDHLYWTEPDNIVDYSHVAGKLVQRRRLEHSPSAVLAFDKSKQTLEPGPCDIQNGGCDEICTPTTYGAECLCSEAGSATCTVVVKCPMKFFSGQTVEGCNNTPGNSCQFTCDDHFAATNTTTLVCQGNGQWDLDTTSLCKFDITYDSFLLVVDKLQTPGKIFHVDLSTPTLEYAQLPLTGLTSPIALGYDHVDSKVYWTDIELKTISRASLDGRDQQVVVSTDVQTPDGLFVDVDGRKIYWTDTGLDHISKADLDGSNRRTIVSSDLREPRAIIVDNINSRIYWSDWGETPRIERADLDGRERSAIVSTDLGWPNGLAIDSNDHKLFWCDARTDRIEFIDLETNERHVLITLSSSSPHPYGLTLTDEYIYWTEWNEEQIQRADKQTGYNVIGVGYPMLKKPYGIHAFTTSPTTEPPRIQTTTTRASSSTPSKSTLSPSPTPAQATTRASTTTVATTTKTTTATTTSSTTTKAALTTSTTSAAKTTHPLTTSLTTGISAKSTTTTRPPDVSSSKTKEREAPTATSTSPATAATDRLLEPGSNGSSSTSSFVPVIGGVIGVLLLASAVILILCGLLYCRRRKRGCFERSPSNHFYWDADEAAQSKEQLTPKFFPKENVVDFGYLVPAEVSGSQNSYGTAKDDGLPSAPPAPSAPSQDTVLAPQAIYSSINDVPSHARSAHPLPTYLPMRPL